MLDVCGATCQLQCWARQQQLVQLGFEDGLVNGWKAQVLIALGATKLAILLLWLGCSERLVLLLRAVCTQHSVCAWSPSDTMV